ncbi:MAG: ferritin family protein [Oscillospiraceae bacterium]
MPISFESSETRLNLMRAFAGESQARNRYVFAAAAAKKEKLEVIRQVFLLTAGQEEAHAKVFYSLLTPLSGENLVADGTFPVDIFSETLEHLRAAHHNEMQEFSDVYPAFSKTATEEGFENVADAFTRIGAIEKTHADRFAHLSELLKSGKLFLSEVETGWICLHCGTIVTATMAPPKCPVCQHDQGYFVRLAFSPFLCPGCFS